MLFQKYFIIINGCQCNARVVCVCCVNINKPLAAWQLLNGAKRIMSIEQNIMSIKQGLVIAHSSKSECYDYSVLFWNMIDVSLVQLT